VTSCCVLYKKVAALQAISSSCLLDRVLRLPSLAIHTGTRYCQTANFTDEHRRVHAKMFSNQCLDGQCVRFRTLLKVHLVSVNGVCFASHFQTKRVSKSVRRQSTSLSVSVAILERTFYAAAHAFSVRTAQPCFSRQQVPSARPAAGSGASAPPAPCPFPAAEAPPPSSLLKIDETTCAKEKLQLLLSAPFRSFSPSFLRL